RSEDDLKVIRNFGSKSIDEVKQKLAEIGMTLKDDAFDGGDYDLDDYTETEQY
ncbi:MAG: DNA-directed RNA polymerase subunit alpha, partial [Propionibacteriaceae bacterium]|nr:DNA-directed RNA polymerase subunit alpha [Propionibacteriaceae bacterium]